MRCKGKPRLVRVIFRDHLVEFLLPVSFIKKARDRGLKVRHPINQKVTNAHYVGIVVYFAKKTFVYVFVSDD